MELTTDLLKPYSNQLLWEEIQHTRKEKRAHHQSWLAQHPEIAEMMEQLHYFPSKHVKLDQDCIEIGLESELTAKNRALFFRLMTAFKPWKKGPFRLFGELIDSEWRSDWKWQRIKPFCGSLQDKKIADIGCHNGYYMMRLANEKPRMVVGFEPYSKHLSTFHVLQNYAQIPQLVFELLGVEHIHFFPKFFDVIFCLGILYHHRDPIGLLEKMGKSLAKGGQVIIDCQCIDGDDPVALTVRRRYAGAKGVWFLPTQACLENWLWRAGFQHVQIFYNEYLSTEEQRTTSWAPILSLADFLDPKNKRKTIEGYPAPRRIYLTASR